MFLPFCPGSWYGSINLKTGQGTSLWSLTGLSLPSRTIPKQDQESLSTPGPDWVCKWGPSSWSCGSVQTKDCYTQSWSYKSWIFFWSFTVLWGSMVVVVVVVVVDVVVLLLFVVALVVVVVVIVGESWRMGGAWGVGSYLVVGFDDTLHPLHNRHVSQDSLEIKRFFLQAVKNRYVYINPCSFWFRLKHDLFKEMFSIKQFFFFNILCRKTTIVN